jgi:hypothetical protein
MSEIPFVNALGDAIEHAVSRRRSRARRRIALGAIAFAVAASGVAAAAGVFESAPPEQLATTGIACYSQADLEHSDVAVLSTGEASPVDTCRRVLHTDGPLVACAGPAVMVLPGPPGTCARLGLRPLPLAYTSARERVTRLAHRLAAIETSADCWDPEALAARVRTLLGRSGGWRGWTVRVQRDMAEGPCGTVSRPGGDGSWSVDGALDTQDRVVLVTLLAARSTLDRVAAAGDLAGASADRCLDVAGAEALARRRLGDGVAFRVRHFEGESVEPLQSRRDEGCAVIGGYGPRSDGYGIEVEIRN